MAKTYQANNFTGKQLDDFMGKVLTGDFAGNGLVIDESGVMHNLNSGFGNLVYSYTHTANKEVHPLGVNLATGTFTAAGHGLSADQAVFVAVHTPYHLGTPYSYLPGGLLLGTVGSGAAKKYYVNVVDENSFTLSESVGGAVVTFTEVSTMDLTKFHFECVKQFDLRINDLPEFDAALLVINGRTASTYRYVFAKPYQYYAAKMGVLSLDVNGTTEEYGSNYIGHSGGWGSIHVEARVRILEPGHALMDTYCDTSSCDANNKFKVYHSRRFHHTQPQGDTFNAFTIDSGGQFYNGTTVEVYTK